MQPFQEAPDPEDQEDPDRAIAVLKNSMLFYRDQAKAICERVIDLLKEQNSRGDLVAMMYKYLNEAQKMTIDCASKLAPYESPKLESIEVKETRVTKFVIEAPTLSTDPDAWLNNTKRELKLLENMRNNAEDIDIISVDNTADNIGNTTNGHTN